MKMEMTERDKKLLIFLAVFVIVVCFGYWGIRPMLKKIIAANEQIADDEAVIEMNEIKISELPLLEKDNEKLEEDIVTARENYFPMMTSDEIDKYFTNMVLSYNLQSYDLTIKIPTQTCTLEPYMYSEKKLNPEPEELNIAAADSDDSEDEEDTEEQEIDSGIYDVTVTMRLGGNQTDLTKLIDDLSASEQKIRIDEYSYTTNQDIQEGTDGAYEVVNNTVLNLTVQIYMCEE